MACATRVVRHRDRRPPAPRGDHPRACAAHRRTIGLVGMAYAAQRRLPGRRAGLSANRALARPVRLAHRAVRLAGPRVAGTGFAWLRWNGCRAGGVRPAALCAPARRPLQRRGARGRARRRPRGGAGLGHEPCAVAHARATSAGLARAADGFAHRRRADHRPRSGRCIDRRGRTRAFRLPRHRPGCHRHGASRYAGHHRPGACRGSCFPGRACPDGASRMIEFEHVHKRFGEHVVIDDLSLRIDDGEFFVLVGPSGSGKSTLLRTVNRLVHIDAGTVRVNGEDVATRDIETLRRGNGYAIQSVGLFSHRTVAENIATVPRLLRWPEADIRARVDELIALLRLDEPGIADRYPDTLSGGQQQRVGVARALAARPRIVLMDEPFGALDPLTRESLQASLKAIQRDTGTTILFVTHDMDEAFGLGDRVGLMLDGTLVQAGTPLELLRQPADERVRDFVGGTRARLRELAVRTVRESMRD